MTGVQNSPFTLIFTPFTLMVTPFTLHFYPIYTYLLAVFIHINIDGGFLFFLICWGRNAHHSTCPRFEFVRNMLSCVVFHRFYHRIDHTDGLFFLSTSHNNIVWVYLSASPISSGWTVFFWFFDILQHIQQNIQMTHDRTTDNKCIKE